MALVLLKVITDPGEAQVARGMLEAAGIPAVLFGEPNPYPGTAMSPLQLMVPEDDAEAAGRLLAGSFGKDRDEAGGQG